MATNQQIAEALIRLTPESKWNLKGDDYADIEWLCECTQPTINELTEEIAKAPQIALALAALKASARAKLVAGQPLTEEEAATLII